MIIGLFESILAVDMTSVFEKTRYALSHPMHGVEKSVFIERNM